MALESFVKKHLELLELERNAEVEENRKLQESHSWTELQRRGVCLTKLRLGSYHTGLYGRCVCSFEMLLPGQMLPSHSFSPGDIVGVYLASRDSNREVQASGVVSSVGQAAISAAFESSFDSLQLEENTLYNLVKLANDVTYRRLKRALSDLHKFQSGRAQYLVNVSFGESNPQDPLQLTSLFPGELKEFLPFNSSLDDSQLDAVKFALCQQEIAIIHGPPGTGKTTTLTEIILQAVKQGHKILVCAPSNVAVDNLVERLSHYKRRLLRLGHPARLLPGIQQYSLDSVLAASDQMKIIQDIRQEIDQISLKNKRYPFSHGSSKSKDEKKQLYKELREREKAALKQILGAADVVLATLTSSTTDGPLKYLPENHFGLVVVDECSQAVEAACWIPLLLAPKCILAGDHLQLPPTIISEQAAKEGLSTSLMERLISLHGNSIVRMLHMQYRMHQDIMSWPSQQLYENKLVAHSSVADHLLRDIVGVQDTEDSSVPLLLIDTAGCSLHEMDLEEESKGNEGEADLVALHVQHLIGSGLKPSEIAVISPYNLQVDLLRLRLSSKYPALEIKSVDGFQGREKEAVVLSLVRSNTKGEVGFLAEDRRINVAITRARRHLAVVCDSETVSHHKFLKSMVDFLSDKGDVRSASQYSDVLGNAEIVRPRHLQLKSNKKQVVTVIHVTSAKDAANLGQKNGSENRSKATKLHIERTSASTESSSLTQTNKEQEESIRSALIDRVRAFINDESQEACSFTPALSAFERRVVHELAESMDLIHFSEGSGADRHIVIRRKNASRIDGNVPSVLPSEDTQNHSNISKETDVASQSETVQIHVVQSNVKCTICQTLVLPKNYDLHVAHCELKSRQTSKDPISVARPVQKDVSGKRMTKKKTSSLVPSEKTVSTNDDDNFDDLIAQALKANHTCAHPGCRTSTSVLMQQCQFCSRLHCLSHHLPEAHGCGDAARADARKNIRKEGVLYPGSGIPSHLPDPTKRAQLHRKMNKKLSEMSQKRMVKKK